MAPPKYYKLENEKVVRCSMMEAFQEHRDVEVTKVEGGKIITVLDVKTGDLVTYSWVNEKYKELGTKKTVKEAQEFHKKKTKNRKVKKCQS